MKTYAGIGSRETPDNILMQMMFIAAALNNRDYMLRSGGARGADTAFERGAFTKTIYYTDGYKHYGNMHYQSTYPIESRYTPHIWYQASQIARKYYHSDLTTRPTYVQKLMTRNVFQILGADLKSPSDFVVCWTKDGKASGGTGQAIRIAQSINIPVYNLYNKSDVEKFKEFLLSI